MQITPRLLLLASWAALLAACAQSGQPAAEHADLVFRNGAVYTVDANRSWASAVAIDDGRIVFVGFDDGLQPWIGPDTKIVDLGGRMLMPSFQDAHIHPIGSGLQAATVDLSKQSTLDGYVGAVKAYAEAHPDEPWIVGGGWRMDVFGPGANASRKLLDAVVAERPVYLTSSDGHTGWANSKALEMAGIDRDTQDPASGIVDRDAEGNIIGSLQEGAMELMTPHIPPPTRAQNLAALKYASSLLNSYGITAIQDAWVLPEQLDIYKAADDAGDLSLRVVAAQWWERDAGLEQIEQFEKAREKYTGGNLDASTVKILQDGVMENYTAAMSEPYFVDGDPTGIPMVDPEFLKEAVTALDASGFQVHFHAIGDAAITQCLDAVAAARAANGDRHNRHHISHLQMINPKDYHRFRELGVIANFQPLWATASRYVMELTVPFIGEERMHWMYAIRSMVNSGAMIAFGSDWFVSTANPFPQIETAVTRTGLAAGVPPFLPEETIDLQTALAAFTINSAYVNRLEKMTGSIEAGKAADLIVLDRNLFAIPKSEISETQVLLTLLNGKAVHGTVDDL